MLSIDCVWLVEGARYGLPAVVLLILTMFSPLLRKQKTPLDPRIRELRIGFSLAIVTMSVMGLTVHFWEAARAIPQYMRWN